MITVEHLTKHYGRAAVVDDVGFQIGTGEALALWGPNGAGKSTIVRCLLGLVGFEGRVQVDGLDVTRSGKAARRLIGHVPQELAFYEDLTVGETLALSAQLRRVPPGRDEEVLALVGLENEGRKRVGALSGGMKQRVAIALALLHDPPVLLLDEPTSNLDVGSREAVIALLQRLRPQKCVLLTTHHLEEVAMLVDRVLALQGGRVLEECEPSRLAERLGLRSWLHLEVGPGERDRALAALASGGFTTRLNSRGVLVEVAAQQKGTALDALAEAGVRVVDLEVWR